MKMQNTTAAMLLAVAAGLTFSTTAMAVDWPEAEPNEGKATATLVGPIVPGDTLSGTSTGTAATAGLTSRDFFRVNVGASAVPQIYRNRLTFIGDQANTGAIMGLAQSGAASDTTTVQTTTTTTNPPRFSQWYSFGSQHELYYRVQGSTATTAPYSVRFDQDVVTPAALGSFDEGPVTITTFGQGHTTDTEIFLFDSNFNLLRLNDDRPAPATDFQSIITETLAAGTYYLAVSNFNTATSAAQEGAATERSTTGNRMDFAGSLARSSTAANVNVAFAITDVNGTTQFPATLAAAYDVHWATFTVVPAPGAVALFGFAGLAAARRRR